MAQWTSERQRNVTELGGPCTRGNHVTWFTKESPGRAWKARTFSLEIVLLWTTSCMASLDVMGLKHVCRFFDTLPIKKSLSFLLEKWGGGLVTA